MSDEKSPDEVSSEKARFSLEFSAEELAERVATALQGDEVARAWVGKALNTDAGRIAVRAELERTRPARARKAATRSILLRQDIVPRDKAH
jgi:uncharacterized small protein (DUF1192 family)